MEAPDKNPFAKIDLFPRLTQVAQAIGSFVLGREESPNRGGAVTLDSELYDKQELEMQTYWSGMLERGEL